MGTHTSAREDVRKVIDAVRRIVQALHESSRLAEKQVGLTGAQLFVLQQLGEAPTSSITEIARRTHTHQSSVSTVVARLVDRGFVRRTRSGTDARHLELSLTPQGRRIAARSPDIVQERFVRAVEGLPASRRRRLAAVLGDLAEAIAAADPPAMFFEERAGRRKAHRRG